MSIKTATRIAILGTAVGMILSLASPYLWNFLTEVLKLHEENALFYNRVYWVLHAIMFEGSILLFLIMLHSKQKA